MDFTSADAVRLPCRRQLEEMLGILVLTWSKHPVKLTKVLTRVKVNEFAHRTRN